MDFLTGTGITVGILALVVGGLVGTANKEGQGATFRERIFSYPPLYPLLIVHYFLPYGLAIMVLFMDIMSQLPQGIFGLVIALVAVFLNSSVKPINEIPNDLCEIPGLKWMASKFMPQSLLFVTIVVTYLAAFVSATSNAPLSQPNANTVSGQGSGYAYYTTSGISTMSPSSGSRITASWILAASVIIFQMVGLGTTPGCLVNMRAPTGHSISGMMSIAATLIIGGVIGGISGWQFSGLSFTQPSYSVSTSIGPQVVIPGTINPPPQSTQSRGPGFVREQFQLGAGLGENPMPPAVGGGGDLPVDIAKSSGAVTPGESSDQFVCEAYKNGQLVTSTLIG